MATTNSNLSSFIWSVADLLRGDYKQSEYGKVILPFTVLRRLDCVLEATKPTVLEELAKREAAGVNPEPFLLRAAKQSFFNTSKLDMNRLFGDADHIAGAIRVEQLRAYGDAPGLVEGELVRHAVPFDRARRWMRSPCLPNMLKISTGPAPDAPNQCGFFVSNSAASPAPITMSCSPSTSRSRPDST